MLCASQVPDLQWSVQKHTFTSDAIVIPLKFFNMVLGEDWLEECSPMWVDWVKKVMRFMVNGMRITLHGLRPSLTDCSSICST
jgi:hypothetical protein